MNILAQVFGLCALILMFYSYQKNNKKGFLLVQTFANLFYGIQYFLLNAFSAMVSNIISIIRCIVFYKYENKNKKIPIYILLIFEISIIILGIFTFENIYSIIPVFIACVYTYGTWQKNLKVTYFIGVIVAALWIIYNFVVGAYVAIIGSVIEFIGSVIGLSKLKNIEIEIRKEKEPYIKQITADKVINLTGESGSGKSFFSNKYINDDKYVVIDTDVVFGNHETTNKAEVELRQIFENKYGKDYYDYILTDFDECYLTILEYFKNSDKIVVIDSALFRNMKEVSNLKGQVIIMRTCIDTCYKRCVDRWIAKNPNATLEEKEKYMEKKKKMYKWYLYLNEFILKVDAL